MLKRIGFVAATGLVAAGLFASLDSDAQTPEQQQLWDAQRAQAAAVERTKEEHLARDRAARKADPMAWVRTLNPMSAGGWEFRAVANDGSWAAFSTNHQMTRSGKTVTVWLRQEYAEPQTSAGNSSHYLSVVVKTQYDCAKEQTRPLLVIYYADNNIQGSEQTEEADTKTAAWDAIVPGTRDESNFLWACGAAKSAARN
jgi:hypothetical protein